MDKTPAAPSVMLDTGTMRETPRRDNAPVEAGGPWQTLGTLRVRTPLVHNITNFVAMDLAANLLLAAGALPAMVHATEEVEDAVEAADALTINIGTLSPGWVDAMAAAARKAVETGRPWVLDPAGAAATEHRRRIAERLAHLQPTVIRGNGSEILALGSGEAPARGVESEVDSAEALDAAHDLAKATGAIVAVTGAVDYVTDGRTLAAVTNGDLLMTKVTAVGCALTCLIGACCAVNQDHMAATAHGLAILGLAGELAAEEARGPGSFRTRLLDALYNLDEATLTAGARIQ
jgi:hydroxyethylthiazole kinase